MNPVPQVTINIKGFDINHVDLRGRFHILRVFNFKVEGDDRVVKVSGNHEWGVYGEWWAKRINDEWWLHHDEFPAYSLGNALAFFQNGHSITVHQLNCDPTLKVCYILKYNYVKDVLFHYYSSEVI